MSKCTFTGYKTLENKHKPLMLKELRKLWNVEEPDLPWEEGDYSPSNTLLVDDSPYKALRNPVFVQPLLICQAFSAFIYTEYDTLLLSILCSHILQFFLAPTVTWTGMTIHWVYAHRVIIMILYFYLTTAYSCFKFQFRISRSWWRPSRVSAEPSCCRWCWVFCS